MGANAMIHTANAAPAAGGVSSPSAQTLHAVMAASAGSLVAVALVVSGAQAQEPLPALGWAAAFLGLAAVWDVKERRIPNALTFPALLVALALATAGLGALGLREALVGAAAAFALLIVPYALGALGAGDVKAAAALGAFLGADPVVGAVSWAVGLGGVFALGLLALRGGLLELPRRWGQSLLLSLGTRRIQFLPPAPGSVAAGGIPFALALGLGAAGHQIWGTPWV